jgi:hypothetical protein
MAKERRLGIPRTDVERAQAHYGATEEEYCAHPEKYPLPDRGAGLTTGTAAGSSSSGGWGLLALLLLLAWGASKARK